MERPLTPLERWYWICDQVSPLTVLSRVHVRDGLPADRLRAGLDALQARHPLLGVAIRADDAGEDPRFVPTDRPIPLRAVTGGGWVDELNEHELVAPVDWGAGPLARAVAVDTGDGTDLVLAVPHCVADGTTVLTLLRQWVELAGGAEPGPPLPARPGPEDLFPAAQRGVGGTRRAITQLISDQAAARRLRPQRMEPSAVVPFDRRRTRLLHRELTGDQLDGLTRACRREQVTVHGALAAAMVLAVAADAGVPAGGNVTIGSPITFRDELLPPVSDREVGTYVATVPSIVPYRPGEPLWPTARAISTDLVRRRQRGEPLTAISALRLAGPKSVAKSAKFLKFMQDKGPITLCISNLGRYDFPDKVGEHELSGAQFVTGLSVNAYFVATVNSSHGRLAWNFTYVQEAVPEERAVRLADGAVAAVLAAAGSTG